jgi:Xaa-Pro aminopeptidase
MHKERIRKLCQQLSEPCLVANEFDLLYLTGQSLSKGRLLATPEGATLFVDGRYYERAKKEAPCPVLLWDEQKNIQAKRIAFDSATITYEGYLALHKLLPKVTWVPLPNPVKNLRVIKEPGELAALRKAAQLTWLGYQHLIAHLKEGVSEEELALEFEIFCRKRGASGLSFASIVAFGANSAYPHYRAGKARLQRNQIVLIDIGIVLDHYHSDMTRVVFFGKADPELARLEQMVRHAQQKARMHIKPGVRLGELDEVVRNEFDRANVKPLYTHSLGHGVGLQGHEYPLVRIDSADKDLLLEAGMVFTVEPGLYRPGLGGVRWEDTILVTETGHENFFSD